MISPLILDLKSKLYDMVCDVKGKWESNDEISRKYDGLIKEMVLNTGTSEADDEDGFRLKTLMGLIGDFVSVIEENVSY